MLPGLFADDGYTAPLRAFLRSRGFEPHGWGQGVNWGRWDAFDQLVLPLLERLHARTGRKVTLYLVADRLAQPEGRWQRFAPPAVARMFYRGA